MARTYSSNILQILESDNLSPYFLIKIQTPTITLMHTNTPSDIEVIGLGLFTADNSLLSIDPPRLSTTVDREAYKISYSV